jgi:hypothetical protein
VQASKSPITAASASSLKRPKVVDSSDDDDDKPHSASTSSSLKPPISSQQFASIEQHDPATAGRAPLAHLVNFDSPAAPQQHTASYDMSQSATLCDDNEDPLTYPQFPSKSPITTASAPSSKRSTVLESSDDDDDNPHHASTKSDNVTIPMNQWVRVATLEEITLQGFVGDSPNYPGVPVGHSRSRPPCANWPDCINDETLRPW